MTETALRHVVAFLATLVSLITFAAGYIAGGYGWWWVGLGLIVVYVSVYQIVNAGHHGGGHH